jgi:hypothetical protein
VPTAVALEQALHEHVGHHPLGVLRVFELDPLATHSNSRRSRTDSAIPAFAARSRFVRIFGAAV